MPVPRVRGFEPILITTDNPADPIRFTVRLTEQPAHRWLIARLYYRLTRILDKVPGDKRLNALSKRVHHLRGRHPHDWIPATLRRGLRYHALREHQRVRVAELNIDADTYTHITGRPVPRMH